MTRAPRLGRRRKRAGERPDRAAIPPASPTRSSALQDIAAAIREPEQDRGSTLGEVAAKLNAPTRQRGSTLGEVAAKLNEPTRRRGSSLESVAAKLKTPRRRTRSLSLAQIAATPSAEALGDKLVADASMEDSVRLASDDSPLDFVLPARPISMQLVSGRGHYERVIAAVTSATTSVWIATANTKGLLVEDARARPGRSRNHRRSNYVSILSLLDELAAKGVELRLLHAELPSGPFREELAQHPRVMGGLALRRCPRVHMKAVIVDGELLYLGSANWTGAGLGAKGSGRRNFELGMVTDDAELLDQVQAIYERVWRGGECAGCKLHDECPGPLSELTTETQLVVRPLDGRDDTPKKRARVPKTSRIGRRRKPRLI